MKQHIKNYLEYSKFTYPGEYEKYLKSLPDDIREIGLLVRKSFIHRTTLASGNVGTNSDLRFGDMTKMPWYRQAEDDNFPTVGGILTELFRRDSRGFVLERNVTDKLVLTCRFVALVMASILKAKNIPARVRSGFASYFVGGDDSTSWDHWVVEYWSEKEERWILIDVDGSLSMDGKGIDPYDVPKDKFNYSASTWVGINEGKLPERKFWNGMPYSGLTAVAWELFYDFHCLMNNEIIYLHRPQKTFIDQFYILVKDDLEKINNLATLMIDPDKNYSELKNIWETEKEFRLLKGGLL